MTASAPIADACLPALRVVAKGMLGSAYRLHVRGISNVPSEGPALVVYNHVAFHDWLFVASAMPRLPRFVMHQAHWKVPALRWFFDLYRVIPIATRKEDPARLDRAMELIDEALAAGELVAMTPEGTMTPDGELSEFRPGVERILARRPVPVVPIAIRGLWGSFFSRKNGEPMKKLPRRVRAPVELVAAPPIDPSEVSISTLRARIGMLRGAPC
jgi:1-acyl-sn-glycerol-3-phosphate acyltransferase